MFIEIETKTENIFYQYWFYDQFRLCIFRIDFFLD
jgi:hypothetical protein